MPTFPLEDSDHVMPHVDMGNKVYTFVYDSSLQKPRSLPPLSSALSRSNASCSREPRKILKMADRYHFSSHE